MSRPPREPSRRNRPRGPAFGWFASAAAILASLVTRTSAHAEELGASSGGGTAASTTSAPAPEDAPLSTPVRLRSRLAVDMPVTLGLTALAVTGAALHEDLATVPCRVCDGKAAGASNALDEGARDALRRPDGTPARTTSHVLAFGAAPVFAVGLTTLAAMTDRRKDELAVDVLVIAEATAAATVADLGLGLVLSRERPRAQAAARADADAPGASGPEGMGSLPATHVTFAFALAASSGTVATMRGYRLAPVVWASGMAVGLATAYARIASDDAWLTDTLAGAGLGTAVGVLVPVLFHAPARPRFSLNVQELRGGRLVGLSGTF